VTASSAIASVQRAFRPEWTLRLSPLLIAALLMLLPVCLALASTASPAVPGASAGHGYDSGDGGLPSSPLHHDAPAKPRRSEIACVGLDETSPAPAIATGGTVLPRPGIGLFQRPLLRGRILADIAAPASGSAAHRRQQGRAPPQA